MRFLELKEKEVINCKDCSRLGYVADVEFDCETGKILAIIVPDIVLVDIDACDIRKIQGGKE